LVECDPGFLALAASLPVHLVVSVGVVSHPYLMPLAVSENTQQHGVAGDLSPLGRKLDEAAAGYAKEGADPLRRHGATWTAWVLSLSLRAAGIETGTSVSETSRGERHVCGGTGSPPLARGRALIG